MTKPVLLSLTPAALTEFITGLGEPKYRAAQIRKWLLSGVDFRSMTDIPAALREKLASVCESGLPEIADKRVSSDGTVKYLFRLADGECVETVLMKYEHGVSACVSSEVGCAMGCAFCASTIGGLCRRLEFYEMLGQVIAAGADSGERIAGIVIMGIGEPLDNYDNIIKFLRAATGADGLNISARRISLSTCGIADKIALLAKENLPITLSISLHAPTDDIRAGIMPISRKYSVAELLSACARYFSETGRRISFEYILIKDLNDTQACADKLAEVLHTYCPKMPLHVNLIPVNPVKERGFESPTRENVTRFERRLLSRKVNTTVRRHLGGDINASCGQLRRANKQ